MNIRAAIFDVDGTLVDSNDAHTRAWLSAFVEDGLEFPYENVRKAIGMGGDKLLPVLAGIDGSSPRGKRLSKRRGEIFKQQYLHKLQPFPEVKALLERLHGDGFLLAVASSAQEAELKTLLQIAGVDHLMTATTSSDDADRSKPDPDVIQVALGNIGLAPEKVVMIGDTPYDMEAARKAGVYGLAVRCGGWDDDGLQAATWIYDSPADLLQRYAESPFGVGPAAELPVPR